MSHQTQAEMEGHESRESQGLGEMEIRGKERWMCDAVVCRRILVYSMSRACSRAEMRGYMKRSTESVDGWLDMAERFLT